MQTELEPEDNSEWSVPCRSLPPAPKGLGAQNHNFWKGFEIKNSTFSTVKVVDNESDDDTDNDSNGYNDSNADNDNNDNVKYN